MRPYQNQHLNDCQSVAQILVYSRAVFCVSFVSPLLHLSAGHCQQLVLAGVP